MPDPGRLLGYAITIDGACANPWIMPEVDARALRDRMAGGSRPEHAARIRIVAVHEVPEGATL